ncbi:MAG TPA: carboxypeptidase regulatory-like domain-containing protein [Acidobacteriaceae bacterium]|nr:carboxypeptidase regulatory-like domain-containing protein [Acidobacteriaceae bacterium]
MLGKNYARLGLAVVPLLALAIAGCHQHARPHPSANGTSGSTAAPAANAQIDPATAGSVSGTIRFDGKAPTPIMIDMAQDPACGQASKTPNMTEQYVVHDGRLANVFVYIKDGLGNRIYMPTKTPVVLDQKGCRYIPHVIGTMVGQPVEFRNSDRTMHNIHIVPPGSDDTSGFDISQPPMAGTEQHIFRNTGLMIPVRCNNHPWMEAFLNVVKTPFFSVSNTNGTYQIQGLPPGTYTLVAVHEKLGTKSQQITIQTHKASTANFTFSK